MLSILGGLVLIFIWMVGIGIVYEVVVETFEMF